jgi:hypothetical protein
VINGAEVRVAVNVPFVIVETVPELPRVEEDPDSTPDVRLVVAVVDRDPPVPVPHGDDVIELFQPVVIDASPDVITGVDPV